MDDKLDIARQTIREVTKLLSTESYITVVAFAHEVHLSPCFGAKPVRATPGNIDALLAWVDTLETSLGSVPMNALNTSLVGLHQMLQARQSWNCDIALIYMSDGGT